MSNEMNAFFTRQASNEGIIVPLVTPTGEATEHWIRMRGVDSDVFRDVEVSSRRGLIAIAQKPPEERKEAIEAEKIKLIACLVIAWSFEQECTLENVCAFLKEAPQIADEIDRIASKRALFFAKRSTSSESSQSTNLE